MADIDGIVKDIRDAQLGLQIQETMAVGIETINGEVESTTAKQNAQKIVFDDLIINAGDENAEIVAARGGKGSLPLRLAANDVDLVNFKASTSATLANMTQQEWFSNIANSAKGMLKFAHRGLSGVAPENTIPAFELAGQAGYFGIETDIQITLDGFIVIHHDLNVDRMTDGVGNIADLSLAQLQALNIDGGNKPLMYPNTKIPLLADYLAICKKYGCYALIELKDTTKLTEAIIDNILAQISQYNMINKSFIMSSAGEKVFTDMIRSKNKIIGLAPQLSPTQGDIDYVKALGNAFMMTSKANASVGNVERANKTGVKLNCWTVDTSYETLSLEKMGVSFITTGIMGVN